jgi:hypothetical protein
VRALCSLRPSEAAPFIDDRDLHFNALISAFGPSRTRRDVRRKSAMRCKTDIIGRLKTELERLAKEGRHSISDYVSIVLETHVEQIRREHVAEHEKPKRR